MDLGSGAAGIFYVSRKYTGPGAAVLNASGISSSNIQWTEQLLTARMGDPVMTYPDPYAARVAAQHAIVSGQISRAFIVCKEGQVWTVGGDNVANNGSVDGNAAATAVADIGFNAIDAADPAIGSLCQHNVHFIFEAQSGLKFINKTYAVRLVYHHDAGAGNLIFKSSILGSGEFLQLYGEGQGFRADFVIVDNPNAIFKFTCTTAKLQQWRCFSFANQEEVVVEIDSLYSTDSNTFCIGNTVAPQSGLVSSINIKVKNLWWGKGQVPGIGAESNDNWYFLIPAVSSYPMQVRIEIDNMDMITMQTDASLFYMQSLNNESVTSPPGGTFFIKEQQIYFYIKNLRERSRVGVIANGWLVSLQGYSYNRGTGVASVESNNNYVDIRFSNADVVSRLGTRWGPPFYGVNNYITLDLGNFYRRQGVVPGIYLYSIGNVTNPAGTSNIITLRGTVIVEDGYIYQGRDSYNTLIFNGCFKARNGTSTLFQLADHENIIFSNCIAIGPAGAATLINSPVNKNVLVNGLVANLPPAATITIQGTPPVIDSAIGSNFS
jgi:hypothetical protein